MQAVVSAERPLVGYDPVLRVGVTGHRALADLARVRRHAEAVFAELSEMASYATAAAPTQARLRVVSPLADGADRVIATAGLDAGAALQCPLPFARATYEHDFDSASTAEFRSLIFRAEHVFELNGDRAQEEAAYEAVGRVVVAQSDVLIAVWDGGPPRGRGGTAQIVEEALAAGVPVVWIDAVDGAEPAVLSAGANERLRSPIASLRPMIEAALLPPSGEEGADATGASIGTFAAERRPRWTGGGLFLLFRNLVLGEPRLPSIRVPDWLAASEQAWRTELSDFDPGVSGPLMIHLRGPYTWADELANYYAGLYRSVFLANFLLSVMAAAFGLVILFEPRLNPFSAAAEILIAATVISITLKGRRCGWHGRWIDYRQLAEQLRPLRFLYLLGDSVSKTAPIQALSAAERKAAWTDWLVRDVERSLGLPDAAMTPAYAQCVRRFLLAEIDGQIGYHRKNTQRMEKVEARLARFGESMFFLVLFVGALDLTLSLLPMMGVAIDPPWFLDPSFTFVGVVLPALGAALFGIRSLGEFSRLAHRSNATAGALARHRAMIADVPEEQLTRDVLTRAGETTAALMMSETADWRTLVILKPLDLPG